MRARAWRCDACGYVHAGAEPPEICPVCGVDASFFSPFEYEEEAPAPAAATPDGGEALRIVIVGAGVAGTTAAEEARRRSSAASIVLVSGEPGLPYYRLNLTRVLAGEVDPDTLPLHPAAWYEEQRIELRFGTVVAVDREARRVRLADGAELAWDRLVLATGAAAFRPPITGAGRPGVHVLRSRADAAALLAAAAPGGRAVCIGGGLLGIEAAGALARRGLAVTVLEAAPWLMPRQLVERAGAVLAGHLAALGVAVRCGVRVEAIEGSDAASGVRLAGGETLPADLVLLSAGVRPEVELAAACGLAVRDGVVVDDTLATSDPAIFAAGDGAAHGGRPFGIWPVAWAQGRVAGANAAGAASRYQPAPQANALKVLALDVFSAGDVAPGGAADEEIVAREREGGLVHLVFRGGRLAGANVLGHRSLVGPLQAAIERGADHAEVAALLPALRADAPSSAEPESETATETKREPDTGGAPDGRPTPITTEAPMSSLKGTRTEKNLLAAFAGESQARNRYSYAASVARKAGFHQIAAIFEETADNEKEHAKRFFKFLEGGMVEITATYPAGTIDDTAGNLLAAAEGEHEEWTELYPSFAAIAKEEGFPQVAAAFTMVARAEKSHEARFRKLLDNVRQERVFEKDEPTAWKCRNCGYVHEGAGAPASCPACQHPRDWFEVHAENY